MESWADDDGQNDLGMPPPNVVADEPAVSQNIVVTATEPEPEIRITKFSYSSTNIRVNNSPVVREVTMQTRAISCGDFNIRSSSFQVVTKSRNGGRGRGKMSHSKTVPTCVKCGSLDASMNVTDEHIESIKESAKKNGIQIDEIRSGNYCRECLAKISPRCDNCKIRPKAILRPGLQHSFSLHCKRCKDEYNEAQARTQAAC